MTVNGCDASAFQGPMDWTKLRAYGLDFGIFKASDNTTNDTTFIEHVQECAAAGAIPFAYHFLSVLKPAGPQIDTMISQCGKVGLQDRRPFLDVEATPYGVVGAALSAWFAANRSRILDNLRSAISCCVDQFGKKPVIYTYPYYWMALGPDATKPEWADLPLWISAPTRADHPGMIPAPWKSWDFHQWTDDHNVVVPVDGYGGPHALLDRFNGTVDDLIAF